MCSNILLKSVILCCLLIVSFSFISCEDNYDFTRINDGDDWQFNDDFTKKEKALFDTLNFGRTANFAEEHMPGTIQLTDEILFYPNPVSTIGRFEYPYKNKILNLVIVNEDFDRKLEFRSGSMGVAFDFSKYAKGYYRIYYVVQDSMYRIIHKGHGDVKKISD